MRKASKVTSIRIDPKLWKRAKIVAIEEDTTLSALIQEALDIVVGWQEIIGESQTAINMELINKMVEIKHRGKLPFTITTKKLQLKLLKKGARDSNSLCRY